MTPEQKRKLKRIEEALKEFPKIVKEKKRRALKHKRLVEKTFGPLIDEILKLQAGKKK